MNTPLCIDQLDQLSEGDLIASFWPAPAGGCAYQITIPIFKNRPETFTVDAGVAPSPWWAYYRAYQAVRELSMGDFNLPARWV